MVAAKAGVAIDFVGFTIGNVFAVAYGSDLAEKCRHLPHIGVAECCAGPAFYRRQVARKMVHHIKNYAPVEMYQSSQERLKQYDPGDAFAPHLRVLWRLPAR